MLTTTLQLTPVIIERKINHLEKMIYGAKKRIKRIQDGKIYSIHIINFIREELISIKEKEEQIKKFKELNY